MAGRVRREEVETLVAAASPHDGFRVKEVVVGAEHSLHLVFYRDGVACNPPWMLGPDPAVGRQVWCRRDLTDADYGDKRRLKMALEAACRFLNTCGDWPQLEAAMGVLWQMSRGQMRFDIPGYHLIDSCVTNAGTFEHVFAAPDSPWAVRWAENEFIDVVALADVARELAEDDDGEDAPDAPATTPGLPGRGGAGERPRLRGEDGPGEPDPLA